MLLGYGRPDSGTKDLVIARYPLDEIIRKSIRKYAGQFIRRRIRLIYEGTDQIVLTDEKWLSFIIEQLLSNAVKYTLKGTVTIIVSEEKKLTVTDTGMGIAPEDLPRIFEKGYTGYNGRMERKSTGIGLYLSQMAAKKLGHQITVVSKLGEGSSFTIDLAEYPLRSESNTKSHREKQVTKLSHQTAGMSQKSMSAFWLYCYTEDVERRGGRKK